MSKRKGKGVASGSSAATFDSRRFVSMEAEMRFHDSLSKRGCIEERGFDNEPGGHILGVVEARNWHVLVQHSDPVVINIVKEFYANAVEMVDHHVMVRQRYINFSPKAINDFYEVPSILEDDYTKLLNSQPNFDTILNFLTVGGVQWRTNEGIPMHFPAAGMTSFSRAWHILISAKLLPSGHLSEVTTKRAVLNYAIQNEYSIDVGHLIYNNLRSLLNNRNRSGIGYCSLIFGLCLQAGVSYKSSESLLRSKMPLSRKKILNLGNPPPGDEQENAQRQRTHRSGQSSNANAIIELTNDFHDYAEAQRQGNRRVDMQLKFLTESHVLHRQYTSEFNTELTNMFQHWHIHGNPGDVHFPQPPEYPEPPVTASSEDDEADMDDDTD